MLYTQSSFNKATKEAIRKNDMTRSMLVFWSVMAIGFKAIQAEKDITEAQLSQQIKRTHVRIHKNYKTWTYVLATSKTPADNQKMFRRISRQTAYMNQKIQDIRTKLAGR